jgi:hypothetical protein
MTRHPLHIAGGPIAECIDRCETCHDACLEVVNYGLVQGGRLATSAHIRLLLDCADACRLNADFMLRGSDFHVMSCALSAGLAERCAEDCERFGDDVLDECAKACRKCAESCRAMAGATTLAE